VKLSRLICGVSLFAGSLFLGACGVIPGTNVETVQPGYTGLLIDLYGGNKGIENAQIVNGRVWYNGYTQDIVVFPTFVSTYSFTSSVEEGAARDESITFAVGGSPVSGDVGVSFGFSTEQAPGSTKTKLHQFYETYRKEPQQFMQSDMRNGLRDCFTRAAEDLKLIPSVLSTNQQKLVAKVRDCLQIRYPVVNISDVSLLGPLRLPPDIQKSINEQQTAQQAAQTAEANKRKVEAEAASNVARAKGEAQVTIEQARAEAEANRLRSGSVTNQLLELERLRVERARIEKWDGQQAPTIQTPVVQLGGK
jgi:regulator of protease activity HflC (stomatin/prohibitin superfamily)